MSDGKATMTQQDLIDADPIGLEIFDRLTKLRPAVAVAAAARALACIAIVADCGPEAPLILYRAEYEKMGSAFKVATQS